MAAVTSGVNFNATTNAATYTTASFTPAANDLLVVTVGIAGAADAGATLTSSVAGQSFTLVDRITTGALHTAFIYVANVLSTAVAQTVTYGNNGVTATGGHIQVNRASGMARVGAAAIRQSAVNSIPANGTITLDFASAFLTANAGIIVTANGGTAPAVPTGWTSLQSLAYTSPTVRTSTVRRDSGETLATISFTSSSGSSTVGVELDTSAAGGGTTAVSADAPASYSVLARVQASAAGSYSTLARVQASAAASYEALARVQASAAASYDVLASGGVLTNTGWLNPTQGNVGVGATAWQNLSNAFSSVDGASATSTIVGAGNHTPVGFSGFSGLSIPAGAVLKGIEFRWVGARDPAGTFGGFSSRTFHSGGYAPTGSGFTNLHTDGYSQTVGSPTFLWGRAWTPADFTSAFGIELEWAANASCTISLDHVQGRVHYETAGGGTTPVSADASASYSVLARVSSSAEASYSALSSVQASASASYATLARVQASASASYSALARVFNSVSATYGTTAGVLASASASYAVLSGVLNSASASYSVAGKVISADAAASYAVLARVQAESSGAYSALNAVQTSGAASYGVLARVQASASASYGTIARVSSSASASYGVLAAVQASAESEFSVLGSVVAEGAASYAVLQSVVAEALGEFSALNFVEAESTGSYAVHGPVSPPPSYVGTGTQPRGTGAISIDWPAHAAGDLGVMIIETDGVGTTLSPAGWAHFPGSPLIDVPTAAGSKFHALWRRAESGAEPVVNVGDSGDHQVGQIIVLRNIPEAGDPHAAIASAATATATAGVTYPALTVPPQSLVLLLASRPNDSAAVIFGMPENPSLTGITDILRAGTTFGNGGGTSAAYGFSEAGGDIGITTQTTTVSTTNAMFVIAFTGAPVAPTTPVSNDAEGSYSVLSLAQASASASYAVFASVVVSAPAAYSVLGRVSADASASYSALNAVQASASASYATAARVQSSASASYAVLNFVQASASADYVVEQRGEVQASASASYAVLARVAGTTTGAFSVLAGARASAEAQYAVLGAVAASAEASYAVRSRVQASASASYAVLASVWAEATGSYVVEATLPATTVLAEASGAYSVLARIQSSASAAYGALNRIQAEAAATYAMLARVQASASASYGAVGRVSASATGAYSTLQAVSASADLTSQVLARVRSEVDAAYVVVARVVAEGAGAYSVVMAVWADASGSYDVGLVVLDGLYVVPPENRILRVGPEQRIHGAVAEVRILRVNYEERIYE